MAHTQLGKDVKLGPLSVEPKAVPKDCGQRCTTVGGAGGVLRDATSSTAAKPPKMRRLGLVPTCRRWICDTQCPQSSRNARRILLLCPVKQSLAPLLWNILMSPAHHLVLRLRGGVQVFVKTLTGKTITLFSFTPSAKTTPLHNNNAF